VLPDQLEHPLLDRRPDRRAPGALLRLAHLVELRHVLHRHLHADLDGLGGARLDHLDVAGAAEEAGRLLDRAHGGGEADPLRRAGQHGVEPLQRKREVGAALGGGDRVHLVDDHRLDAGKRLPRGGREQQKQGLRRGDQDVWRSALEGTPLVGGRVAGAHAHRDVGRRHAEAGGGVADAGERGSQVSLDVDRERLERAHVEHAAPPLGVGRDGLAGQPVERPEERGQRLARAGGGDDQCVVAVTDRPPGTGLRLRRRRERGAEPLPRRPPEALQHIHHATHTAPGVRHTHGVTTHSVG
jgi:hypothetical protein